MKKQKEREEAKGQQSKTIGQPKLFHPTRVFPFYQTKGARNPNKRLRRGERIARETMIHKQSYRSKDDTKWKLDRICINSCGGWKRRRE
eukprot:384920-Hanusia_phi.AAC.1